MEKVRICTGCNEWENIYYYRDFTVVTELPKVGEEYKGRVVLSVEEVRKDPGQPSFSSDEYDCFAVSLEPLPEDMSEEGKEPDKEFVAISIYERNHYDTLIRFPFVVPTIEEANILIDCYIHRSPALQEEADLNSVAPDELIQKLFGISPEMFEEAMLVASLVRPGSMLPMDGVDPEFQGARLVASPGVVEFQGLVPYYWDKGCALEITVGDVDGYAKNVGFPERTVRDLHPDVFSEIVTSFLECGKDWMAEEGFPPWFHMISLDIDEMSRICGQITEVLSCPFKDLLKKAGISQREFSRRFFVGIRTVEEWCSGKNQCKVYLRLLFADRLGLLD